MPKIYHQTLNLKHLLVKPSICDKQVQLSTVFFEESTVLDIINCIWKYKCTLSCLWSIKRMLITLHLMINYSNTKNSLVPTWTKVYSGIEALYGATLEVAQPSSICGEQHHLVSQVEAEQLGQVTHVVVVTGKVAAILVLHLSNRDGMVTGITIYLGKKQKCLLHRHKFSLCDYCLLDLIN